MIEVTFKFLKIQEVKKPKETSTGEECKRKNDQEKTYTYTEQFQNKNNEAKSCS